MVKKKPLGYSLHLDLYDCEEGVLNSIDLCTHFLNSLVKFIGMHKQSEPSVVRTDSKKFQGKGGLSGSVMLAESSITIHTMSDTFFVSIDVYSCKEFDRKRVKEFVKAYCLPEKVETYFLVRGRSYK
jgi:S-adenosylmethionine decarboxylase